MIGISGMFSKTPIGETMWNRSATSGNAAAETTAETEQARWPTNRTAFRGSFAQLGPQQVLDVVERATRSDRPGPVGRR